MARFLAGVAATLLLVTAGFFIWRAQADRVGPVVAAAPTGAGAAAAPLGFADVAESPTATEKTREQKRFSRYDHDKNGIVGREEYLAARRKAFAKLDIDHDGKLSFEEYAVKTVTKFTVADRDRNGALTPIEFATTRVVRKAKPRPKCPPSLRVPAPDAPADDASAEG